MALSRGLSGVPLITLSVTLQPKESMKPLLEPILTILAWPDDQIERAYELIVKQLNETAMTRRTDTIAPHE